jgi:hypothetical protein
MDNTGDLVEGLLNQMENTTNQQELAAALGILVKLLSK